MTDSNARPERAAQSPVARPLYDRARWEQALLASGLQANAKFVGLALASLAGDAGYLPAGNVQSVRHIARLVGLQPNPVRVAMTALGVEKFILRPRAEGQSRTVGRPITLTLPSSHTGGHP
ncbi:hypothetical protein [Streptomyces sp. NPDC047070]|uniref:hypothetical protein n=1 Tax=Streptomyces sp. NPDC047070 TaxID=3154923 RepID=UPI003454D889